MSFPALKPVPYDLNEWTHVFVLTRKHELFIKACALSGCAIPRRHHKPEDIDGLVDLMLRKAPSKNAQHEHWRRVYAKYIELLLKE